MQRLINLYATSAFMECIITEISFSGTCSLDRQL